MKKTVFFMVLLLISNYCVMKAQSKLDTVQSQSNYLFKDFNGKTYQISDFKGKYIYFTYIACEIMTDTAKVGRYLRFYDKVAKNKPNWIFINIFWSKYNARKSSSLDKNFEKWNKIIKSYNLKNESVICLYENKNNSSVECRMSAEISWSVCYINKEGRKIPNPSKDATKENIKEFENMIRFNEHSSSLCE